MIVITQVKKTKQKKKKQLEISNRISFDGEKQPGETKKRLRGAI